MKKTNSSWSLTLLATLLFWTASLPAQATHVTVFINTAYVDCQPGNPGAEASNIEAAAASFGHTVSSFTGITGTDFSSALADQEAFIMPDLEAADLAPDLSPEAIAAIDAFVTGGGRLLITNSDDGLNATNFLNAVFGFSLAEDSVNTEVPSTITSAALGTIFESQAANLPGNDATMAFNGLPAEGISIYDTAFGASMIYIIPVGAGEIVYLGYDWFESDPPNPGLQDGGWSNILAAALADTDLSITKVGTPNPVTIGDDITFTLTVTNNGPNAAPGVVVTDAFPAELIVISANPSQGSCTGTTTLECSLGLLPVGASATVAVVASADAEGTFDNTALVASEVFESDTANNQDTEIITVNQIPSPVAFSGSGCSLHPVVEARGSSWWALGLTLVCFAGLVTRLTFQI